MADQAPQATLNGVGKLQKNGSTVWYCGRGQGTYPPEFRIRNSESGIPEQINLALALVHSDVCSAGNPEIPQNIRNSGK